MFIAGRSKPFAGAPSDLLVFIPHNRLECALVTCGNRADDSVLTIPDVFLLQHVTSLVTLEVYGARTGIHYSQAFEKQKVANSEFQKVVCILREEPFDPIWFPSHLKKP